MVQLFCVIAARYRAAISAGMLLCLCVASFPANAEALYVTVGDPIQKSPMGWVQFCETYRTECDTQPLPPRDVVLSAKVWKDLLRVDRWANHNIKPMTDMAHYRMIQWWRYPDDGAGACHSYALLKRRLLMQAGFPRQALLMTIVRETNGEGHAVLTVKTDRGEFILDNLTDDILLWSETPYRYYQRQTQDDPNSWVSLDDRRTDLATLSIRKR